MTRNAGSWAVAVTLTFVVMLSAGWLVHTHRQSAPGDDGNQPSVVQSTSWPESSLTPPPSSPDRTKAELDDSLHIDPRYAARYAATSAGWDEVIDSGKLMPKVSKGCAQSWRASGLDRRLDWSAKPIACLDELGMPGYRPQGVGGTATANGYSISGQRAVDRNIVITSWYSLRARRGAFSSGADTRLMVTDLGTSRYNTVELVRPDGKDALTNIESHGSGLVWVGHYLYSSSRGDLWMYNADDLLEVKGRYVLPAVAHWSVDGTGALSSISVDQSRKPYRLQAINYAKADRAYVQSFALEPDGSLADHPRGKARGLRLTNTDGDPGVRHSVSTTVVLGSSYQGVASSGAYSFANSSSMLMNGRKVDALVVQHRSRVVGIYQFPHGNGQSIYLDRRRGTLVSVTERGRQFLYQLPFEQLTGPP